VRRPDAVRDLVALKSRDLVALKSRDLVCVFSATDRQSRPSVSTLCLDPLFESYVDSAVGACAAHLRHSGGHRARLGGEGGVGVRRHTVRQCGVCAARV
jgi:hypothetical protein